MLSASESLFHFILRAAASSVSEPILSSTYGWDIEACGIANTLVVSWVGNGASGV